MFNTGAVLLLKLLPRGLDRKVNQLFVLGFLNEFGRTLVTVFLPLYLFSELKAPYELVGLALTITTGTSAFFQVLGGVLADSWGRRRALLMSSGIKVPLLVMLAIGSKIGMSILIFVALFTATEALSGIFLTSAYAMIADVVETRRRAEAYGVFRVGDNLGFALGAFVGGLVLDFGVLFAIWLFCTSLVTVAMLFFVGESRESVGEKFHPVAIIRVARERVLLELGLASLMAGVIANQMGATFALYTTIHLNITREQLGSLYSLNGLLVIVLQYPLSRLALRYHLSKLLAVASAIRAFGYLLVVAASDFYLLQVVMVALTVGEMLQAPAGASYAASIAPETKRGEYLGFYNWTWNTGQALSPIVGGFLLGALVFREFVTWYVIFIVGVACSFVYIYLGRKARRAIPRLEDIL